MPPKVSPHFLGLQLSVDALRAIIVDEQLELVGSEYVDFDAEFPEYKYVQGSYSLLALFYFKASKYLSPNSLPMSQGHAHDMAGHRILSGFRDERFSAH